MSRRLLLLPLAAALVLAAEQAAAGGGSSVSYDQASYQPGDAVSAWIDVYDIDQARADGPFGAWLSLVEDGNWGELSPTAVYVGDLTFHDGPAPDGVVSPYHATIDFTLPDLAPGEYTMNVCNWPCTTGLADMTWGGDFLVPGPTAPTTTTTLPTTTTTTTTSTTTSTTTTTAPTTTTDEVDRLVADTGSGGGGWDGLSLGFGAGLVVVAALWVGWGRRQRTVKPA